jgi:porphobilinogen synthase
MFIRRFRRLRMNPAIRNLVRETSLCRDDLILPLFVCAGDCIREPLAAVPGSFLLAGKELVREARRIEEFGISAVLLFGVVEAKYKDAEASCCWSGANPVMPALRLLRQSVPNLMLIADLCLCEYTSHGHCGLLINGELDNDATLSVLARSAVALAEAGAGAIAPSGMMDGTTATLRAALDAAGHKNTLLMPYAKFQSVLYGPFKTATCSHPGESKHATHQMDVANGREALSRIRQDVAEGADIVIVKPAISSLDVLALARREIQVPLAAYDVSGSYRMVVDYGGSDIELRRALMMETLTAIKRAGADLIITYHAPEAASLLE